MRYKTWQGWNAKELLRLEALRMEGLTAAQIAAEMGRPFNSVRNQLSQRRLYRPNLIALRYLPLVQMPHTLDSVAQALRVTRGAVKQAKRKLRNAGFTVQPATWRGKEPPQP